MLHNGKRDNLKSPEQNMLHNIRREMLSENIARSLGHYFSGNIDKYGPACVSKVILSEDAKNAVVIIDSGISPGICLEAIKKDRKEIIDCMLKYFKVKTLPRLKFFFNETQDF